MTSRDVEPILDINGDVRESEPTLDTYESSTNINEDIDSIEIDR